ncbi:MAG TPA: PCI domain-containing protein [Candidatus Deferrimicrobium sp.]|nr:PCI domain-containing protein [Candidatus Deferrimicrobium sp.]
MAATWEPFFKCDRCGTPLTILLMKGTGKLVVVGRCPNGHRRKFYLPYANIIDWAPALDSHLFKCKKCDAAVTFNSFPKGPYVKIQVICPTHGKNETRLIPSVVYSAMTHAKNQPAAQSIETAPSCQNCGGVTTYIPQYSRYYCNKCQRYVEDQKVVEKVRSTPESGDFRSKVKSLAVQLDKNVPIALCDLPSKMNVPNVDSAQIETILNEMIIQGEIAGEVDQTTGYVTFFDRPASRPLKTPMPTSVETTITVKPRNCAKCGSALEYIEAKEAYFCRECFEYTDPALPTGPAPFGSGIVEAVRDFDYVGGQVRFKVAIRNKSKLVITNIGIELDIPTEFKLIRILPDASLDDLNRGLAKIEKLMPNSSQGIDYYLEPVSCGMGVVAGLVKYLDAGGNYNSAPIKGKEIAIKCPLIFTPEEANIAMIRNLMKNLPNDYRRWPLPSNPHESFALLHNLIKQFEISHIQAFQISGSPYEVESWYYTRAKSSNHPITICINCSERKNILDLIIGCEDMAELTGLLAKLSEDFQNLIKNKFHFDFKPAFSNLKELLCECGSPLSQLPTLSQSVICNSCQKIYTWEMLG